MGVSPDQLQRAVSAAKYRESLGYFARVKSGDQRAASLFSRLVAFDLNPDGKTSDYGWLSKSPGETQVDGFAEDAICFSANPNDLENVVDLVIGAGAPGASIGGAVKQRRETNKWVRPHALSAEEIDYLLNGGAEPVPIPPTPTFGYPDENTTVRVYQERVRKAYNDAGRIFPDPNDSDAFRWFTRYGFDCGLMPEPESAKKHIAELRAMLGVQPE